MDPRGPASQQCGRRPSARFGFAPRVAVSVGVRSDAIEAWKTKYARDEAPDWVDSWIEVRLSKLFSYQERD